MKTTMTMAALSLAFIAAAIAPAHAAETASATVVSQQNLSTAAALQLAQKATDIAASRDMKICIAVTDADGHLLAFTRMQGAYAGCVEASIAKAKSAARFAINTITFYDLARKENLAIGTIPGILPAVGGVVVKHGDSVIGSVGVSGATDLTEQQLAVDVAASLR
ncbi:heme-binding protein [Pseudomonas asiatica]|uniref:GlcG/HbpS family heme-binding protein n=1 Tax=Pseudomonas asiatica TaxID=2219225 RepID=UPI002570F497|nr:heme-binding protein [Pseudomonas asiatica]WJD72255.1 heme-binding protein [Pseudomonas asiatica]